MQIKNLFLLSIVATLSACGGGSDSSGPTTPTPSNSALIFSESGYLFTLNEDTSFDGEVSATDESSPNLASSNSSEIASN